MIGAIVRVGDHQDAAAYHLLGVDEATASLLHHIAMPVVCHLMPMGMLWFLCTYIQLL